MNPSGDRRTPNLTSEATSQTPCLLSVVIPVYNEEEVLGLLLKSLRGVLEQLDGGYEIVFVNDGSRDRSAEILQRAAAADHRIRVLNFSRNFGHQAAVTAGLDFARGDAVVVMDADLQDPPELLPEMLALYQQGYDVVSAQRIERDGDGRFKRWTAAGFYWLMRKAVDSRLQAEVGDFRLFSRQAVEAIRQFREQHRFMRGLVAWLGLKEVVIPFRRKPRVAGTTKYPLRKMLQFAWTAISSFSALPLRLTTCAGMLLSALGVAYVLYVLYVTLILKITTPGWSSLVCIQIICAGAILMAIGLVGEYVARLFDEAKRRPLYVVQQALNVGREQAPPPRTVVLYQAESESPTPLFPAASSSFQASQHAHDRV